MNKADLINHLSTRLGGRRIATVAVEAMVDVVIREVAAGGSVGITGFGTFERAERAPRTGRNPRTGDLVPIAGTSTPRFRPGTQFKAMVAEPDLLPAEGMAGGRASAGSLPRRPKTTAQADAGLRTSPRSGKDKPAKTKPASSESAKASTKDTSAQSVIRTSSTAQGGEKKSDKKKGGKKKSGKKKSGKKK